MIKDQILSQDKELACNNKKVAYYFALYVAVMVLTMVGVLGAEGQEIAGIPLTIYLIFGFIFSFLALAVYAHKILFKPWAEKFDAQDNSNSSIR